MSAISELLGICLDYERIHQILLAHFINNSNTFANALLGRTDLKAEIEKNSMDVFLTSADGKSESFIEIKMWSALSSEQCAKHKLFIQEHGVKGYYLLLGTSQYEYDSQDMGVDIHPSAFRLSYGELIDALRATIQGEESETIIEMARDYATSLENQLLTLENSITDTNRNFRYYYVLFDRMRKALQPIKTRVYSVQHPGGEPNVILNPIEYLQIKHSILGIDVELYFELQNDRLILKYHLYDNDQAIRNRIRDAMFEVAKAQFSTLRFRQSNRHSRKKQNGEFPYVTSCSMERDFGDPNTIEESCSMFRGFYKHWPDMVKKIIEKVKIA